MKKVLLISDGESFPQCAFDFACKLNEAEPILLTGLFLPPMNYILTLAEAGRVLLGLPLPENYVDVPTVREVINRFKDESDRQGIEYRVHSEITSADEIAGDIRIESRFSDLIVLGNPDLGDTTEATIQDEGIDVIVRHAECPVMIVPEGRYSVQRVIMAYDGSASAMHAIKQFLYLFPDMAALDTEIMYADAHEGAALPEFEQLKEFAARHIAKLTLTRLELAPERSVETWLRDMPDSMIVMGSGGRSWISRFFRKSFVKGVTGFHRTPVFTAHR